MIFQRPLFKHIGHGHVIQVNRVVAVIPPETTTAKTYMKRAKEAGMYIDASRGRSFRSVLILDDGYVVSAALSVPTVLKRFSEDYEADYTDQSFVDQDMEDLTFEAREGIE